MITRELKMMEKFEEIRYEFEKQKEKYLKLKTEISKEKKYELLNKISKDDIWAYFQLSIEILFDLASEGDLYRNTLEDFYHKIKLDMASGPFFQMLIKIGKEKPKIGLSIYNEIQKESNNKDMKSISGLILGGYSIKDEKYLDKLLEKKEVSYPLTNTTLKAILVVYEDQKQIPLKVYNFLDLVSSSNNEAILIELLNICSVFYKIDEEYFYKLIKRIMEKKKSRVNGRIFIRHKKMDLSKEKFIELVNLTKDCDEFALSEIMYAIVDYPKEIKKISDLFIYWINRNLEFKIGNFDWALQELTKKNEKFIGYFLDNFQKVKTDKIGYIHIFPRIFVKLASQNIEFASKEILEKKINEKDEELFYALVSKIIGIIYKEKGKKKMFDLFLPLAKKVEEISKDKDFINNDKERFDKIIKLENFDNLIDYTNELLEQLRFRIMDFDFGEINKSLESYKELYNSAKDEIKKLENKKRYSPLFWIGNWKRDEELKKAYLGEIEKFLVLSSSIKNERNPNNRMSLIKNLGDEPGFWDNFSEFIFTNKFISKAKEYKMLLEPKIPYKDKYSDLFLEMNNKKIFFEIKNSKGDRSLHLDNGAVSIKNKVDKIIKDKSSQFYSEDIFSKMEEKEWDGLYFIVIDTTSSVIDEHMIANSFFGNLAYQFYINNETNERTEGQWVRQDDAIAKEKKVVSGLISFKRQLVTQDGEMKIILSGDIVSNPYAVNKPTEDEIKKLKEIIFN